MLDFVHFAGRFAQPFDLQSVTHSCHGVFKPMAGVCNRLQVKILQNSPPQNVQSRAMQFYALKDDRPILAWEAARGTSYRCPECHAELRLRGGPHRQIHFYHLRATPSCRQNGKSATHLGLQLFLSRSLPPGETGMERPFPEIGRIGDVAWEKHKIVFEIQCSPLTRQEAQERCRDYALAGWQVVWLLHTSRFNKRSFSSAEAFLRERLCYFTNFSAQGQGHIYDQFEVCHGGLRTFISAPFPVDLSQPLLATGSSLELPHLLKQRLSSSPLYFKGDLLHRLLRQAEPRPLLAHWRTLEQKALPPKPSLWRRLHNTYISCLDVALERWSKK